MCLKKRYDYIAKGTFLSRKEDFHTKGRFYFKILNSLTITMHVLSFKRLKEIGDSFCKMFTSLSTDFIKTAMSFPFVVENLPFAIASSV